jgi:putative ubiquitin-RnfH superfamily antitoxin RatB of RatAB toxin-antitoxin module
MVIMSDMIKFEVAYATPALQKIISLSVPKGTSIFDAACESGIEKFFPEINYDARDMGVFGKVVKKNRKFEKVKG